MITVWSSTSRGKVISNLSPVLKNYLNISVEVVSNFSVPEGTKIVLALGASALAELQSKQLIAKNRTVTSLRTQPIFMGLLPLLVSYSADISEIDSRYYTDLLTDVSLAVRYVQTGSFTPVFGNYEWVSDLTEFTSAVKKLREKNNSPVEVMLDLETLGLDPYRLPTYNCPGATIITLQASHTPGMSHVVRFYNEEDEQTRLKSGILREQIEWLLNSPDISLRGANLKFDLHWLWVRGKFQCSNFKFDTTLVGSILDENRSNSLDVHVKIYAARGGGYSDEFDRTVDKSRMDLALIANPEKFLQYSSGDVDFGLEVAISQKKELVSNPDLARFYVNILHPAGRAFEQIEQGGVCIDLNAFKELQADLETEQTRLIKEASKILGGRIVAKHRDPFRFGGINLTKASLLKDFMFSPMGLNLKPKMFTEKPDKDNNKVPSTTLEHMETFAKDPKASEFIKVLSAYGSATKTYNTYVVGFLKHVRSDGRFHPTYFLFAGNRDEGEGGTNTGRLSAVDPSFQTVPKRSTWAKRIRRCYVTPPGHVMVERDFSQGELRVVACIADEPDMLKAYRDGVDLHALTGAAFLGLSYEEMCDLKHKDKEAFDQARQAAKGANFGCLYGQGAEGYRVYSEKSYGVVMSFQDAEERHAIFFKRYPGLLRFHNLYKKLAHRDKQVVSPLGRIRHLPLIDSSNRAISSREERRALNSPVQSTLSDMLIWALAIEHQQGMSKVAPAFGAIHDAAYNYVREDFAEKDVTRLLEIQENLPFEKVGWHPQIPFPADAKYGPNMADLKEFKR